MYLCVYWCFRGVLKILVLIFTQLLSDLLFNFAVLGQFFFERNQRDSSLKNDNYVINYSLSCCSKPLRPSFIFGNKLRYFGWNPRAFWFCIDSSVAVTRSRPKNIVRTSLNSPGYISGSTVILWSYENTFCVQRKQEYDFIQQFIFFRVSLWHVFTKVPRRMHVMLMTKVE